MDFHSPCSNSFKTRDATKYVVFPHTYQVRDYAPALACRMGQVLIGDVVAIEEGPSFVRQLMQGRLNGSYRHSGDGPCFVSVQAGAFRAMRALPVDSPQAEPRHRSQHFTPTIDAAQIRTRPANRSARRSRRSIWARRSAL